MLEALFQGLVAVTPWATVLTALLLAARCPLAPFVPARAFRAVWLLLAVRLVLPLDFSLPQAPLAAPMPAPLAQALAPLPAAAGKQAARAVLSAAPVPTAPGVGWAALLPWLWLVGMAAFLLAHGGAYWHFQRGLRRRRTPLPEGKARQAVRQAFRRPVCVYIAPGLAGPMLTGLVRPVLYLPENMPVAALPYALAHEARHRRAGDVPLLFLLLAANACQWFNPLVYAAVRRARRDIELACDEAVLAGRSLAYRQNYGAALLETLRRRGSPNALSTGFGGGGQLKGRLMAMFDLKRKKGGALLIAVVLAVVVASSTLIAYAEKDNAQSVPAAASPASDEEGDSSAAFTLAPETEPGEGDAFSMEEASSAVPTPAPQSEEGEKRPDSVAAPLFPLPGREGEISLTVTPYHKGLDIPGKADEPIQAMLAGTVLEADYLDNGYGYSVMVDCGDGIRYFYSHCSGVAVQAGDSVQPGQVLAYLGDSGNTSGHHVHVELFVNDERRDPLSLWPEDIFTVAGVNRTGAGKILP